MRDVQTLIQEDEWANLATRLLMERFQSLTLKLVDHHERVQRLTPSNLGEDGVGYECAWVMSAVIEYRRMVNEFMKLRVLLANKAIPRF